MVQKLSCYILTKNSERYLAQILEPLASAIDDLLIVDSGSTDQTVAIAKKYGARVLVRPFDNFKSQRNFALENCQNNWVLSLDSDEVPNPEFIDQIKNLKLADFKYHGQTPDSFGIKRRWILFGKEVHAFLPCSCPDYPIRIFRKDKVTFGEGSNEVHETPTGSTLHVVLLEGCIFHYSCDSVFELFNKMNHYTTLAAREMKKKGRSTSWPDIFIHAFGAWVKWYFRKGGYKDGSVGLLLGIYAGLYTFFKYLKLKFD
mgnify:CR=1 FL=1